MSFNFWSRQGNSFAAVAATGTGGSGGNGGLIMGNGGTGPTVGTPGIGGSGSLLLLGAPGNNGMT